MDYMNIFDGCSKKAIFALTAYELLMRRIPVTYADVITKAPIRKARVIPDSPTNSDHYGELKKAFPEVINAIKDIEGEKSIIINGTKRNRSFLYQGTDNDPLKDIKNAKVIHDLKMYWQFCQDSAGLLPMPWLDYFFNGYQDLFQIKIKKNRGEQVIIADHDRQLTNIDLLPGLYKNIINHQVLKIQYKPFDKEVMELEFHPHLLKEYNGRWFMFGHAEGKKPEFGFNLALDRIVETPVITDKEFVSPPSGFYSDYFKNIVGVTRQKDHIVNEVTIRAHSHYTFKRTDTKKLHPSQTRTKPFGKYDDGEYGEFTIKVEVNEELIGRILQMGTELEIVGPQEVREIFRQRVKELSLLYESD